MFSLRFFLTMLGKGCLAMPILLCILGILNTEITLSPSKLDLKHIALGFIENVALRWFGISLSVPPKLKKFQKRFFFNSV